MVSPIQPRKPAPRCSLDSLAYRFPMLARQWHPTKNGALTPAQVTAGSEKCPWWKCRAADDHEWLAYVNNRVRHPICPFCAHKRVALDTSLAATQPRIARIWHLRKATQPRIARL